TVEVVQRAVVAPRNEPDFAHNPPDRRTAGTPSTADELARLADLKAQGVIDEAEFQALKAKAIS
ncbi:MAG: SHOCT domain-containing protein, partial [Actinomycetota bacterium]|nr:SHOCT domain-containing protein [Actinomycetota bacterium]